VLKVSGLDVNDYGICTNYLTEEYERTVGPVTYRISGKFYADISSTEFGYKVSDGSKIVAFVAFHRYEEAISLVNFFVAQDYRRTEAFYLLSKAFNGHLDDTITSVMYLPMKKGMVLPSSVCVDGVLYIDKYKEKLEILEKRWGNG